MFDPKQVGEEADALIRQLNQPTAEDQGTPEAEAIATQADNVTPDDTDQGVNTDAQPEVNDGQSESAVIAELRKQIETADSRWRVLQGMIDKKDSEIEQMRQLFAQLQAAQPAAPAPTTEIKPEKSFTQEEMSSYGEDSLKVMVKAGRLAAAEEVAKLRQWVEDKLSGFEGNLKTVQTTTAQTASDRFLERLESKVPTYKAVNLDPAFMEWLQVTDRHTGVSRHELLKAAYGRMDVSTTAAFFEDFIAETSPPAAPAAAPEVNVHKLVAPSKGKTSSPRVSDPTSGKVWSRADISKLYDDRMAGRISAKDFEELERDLFKAQRENRIAA